MNFLTSNLRNPVVNYRFRPAAVGRNQHYSEVRPVFINNIGVNTLTPVLATKCIALYIRQPSSFHHYMLSINQLGVTAV